MRPFGLLSLFLLLLATASLTAAESGPVDRLLALEAEGEERILAAAPTLRDLSDHRDRSVRLEAVRLLGRAAVLGGHGDRAPEIWAPALDELRASDGEAWARLQITVGEFRFQQGQLLPALELLEPVVRELPDSDLAIAAADLCGQIHLARDDAGRAENSFVWAIDRAERRHSDPAGAGIDMEALRRGLAAAKRAQRALANGADLELFREAESQRRRGRWSEAQSLYERLVAEFPDSAHVYAARWAIGACLLGGGEVDRAEAHWVGFVEEDPAGPYRGQTLVSLGDIQLEHRFELTAAAARYDEALAHWSEHLRAAGSVERVDASWQGAAFAIHLREGLVAYIRSNRRAAGEYFRQALPHAPPPQPLLRGLDPTPRPIEKLIELCRRGQDLTPTVVLRTAREHQKAALMCFLSDFYLLADQPAKAQRLFERVMHDGEEAVPAAEVQRAYATYRSAEAIYEQGDFGRFYERLNRYLVDHDDQPWTPDVLLRKGVAEYTRQEDSERAIRTFTRLARDYPEHELAVSAMWYRATAFYWEEHWAEARRAYLELNRRYPENGFRPLIEEELLPEIASNLTSSPTED